MGYITYVEVKTMINGSPVTVRVNETITLGHRQVCMNINLVFLSVSLLLSLHLYMRYQ